MTATGGPVNKRRRWPLPPTDPALHLPVGPVKRASSADQRSAVNPGWARCHAVRWALRGRPGRGATWRTVQCCWQPTCRYSGGHVPYGTSET